MISKWQKKEILIIVKTYPEYSSKYTETVCTGGVLAASKNLIRIYPIRYRYLDGKYQFSKYQWINAEIKKAKSDNRAESYNIKDSSIELGAIIPSSRDGWQEREKWVLSPNNIFESLEALNRARENTNVSLGIIKPKEIVNLRFIKKSNDEIQEATQKKNSIMSQLHMLEEKKDLDLFPIRFVLHFFCDDHHCNGHNISILDWEIGQLYRRLKDNANMEEKIREKVMNEIFAENRETHLFLGNMSSRRNVFCILGFFWPPRQKQLKLFNSKSS
jgi:flagellar biosynthesis/type III secretory pathway chaperone